MNEALVSWNQKEHMWELLLRTKGEDDWTWSKGWKVKDEDFRSGYAWVFDSILCEIAHLQDMGWKVTVKL